MIDYTEQAKFFHSVTLKMSVKLNQKLIWAYIDTPLDNFIEQFFFIMQENQCEMY